MKKIGLKRIGLKRIGYDICEYILACCLIINCRAIWLTIPGSGDKINSIVNLMIVFAVCGCVLLKGKYKIKNIKCGIKISIALLLYLLFFILVNGYNRKIFLVWMIICICLNIYIFVCNDKENYPSIFEKYINIMVVIGIISIVIWLMGSVFHVISPNMAISTTWTSTGKPITVPGYWGIQFERQISDIFSFLGVSVRNSSFFAEAPMASFNFSIALLLELLVIERKKHKYKIITLILAILTTFASTGYLIVIGILGYGYFKYKPKKMGMKIIKIFIIPIVVGVVGTFIIILVLQKLGTSSGNIRVEDFVIGYNIWRKYAIWGCGYENNDLIKTYFSISRTNMGFSNSLTQILAQCGLYIFVLYIYCFMKGIIQEIKNKNVNMVVFIIVFFALFAFTLVSYQYVVVVILLFMLSQKDYIKIK